MKAKKKRTKKYNPKKHRIGYLDMLDISANKGLSDRAAASIELDYRIHRNSRRKPPNSFGWRNAANLSLPIYLVVPDERRVSFHPLC